MVKITKLLALAHGFGGPDAGSGSIKRSSGDVGAVGGRRTPCTVLARERLAGRYELLKDR